MKDIVEIIIKEYEEGKSLKDISSKLRISKLKVKSLLIENNVEIRKRGLANSAKSNKEDIVREYKEGSSINLLTKKYNSTYKSISNLLKENDVNVRNLEESLKSDNINNNFFKVIDTEEKAYILGLLYADGSLSMNRKVKTNYSVSLGLKGSDRYILDQIRYIMNSSHKITEINRKDGLGKSQDSFYRFAFNNKTIFNDLLNLGLDKKSSIPNIPNELIHHFIRGIFDGDGCISISSRSDADIHIMGEENLLYEINNYINFNKPKLVRNIYRIRKSGRLNSISFSNYIYKDSTIYLKRKFNIFCRLNSTLQES